jgi:hypothetical protein
MPFLAARVVRPCVELLCLRTVDPPLIYLLRQLLYPVIRTCQHIFVWYSISVMKWILIGVLAITVQPTKQGKCCDQAEYAYQTETKYNDQQSKQRTTHSTNETDNAHPDRNATNQHQSDSDQKKSYWQDAFAPSNLVNWCLVLIGWLGVWAAGATFAVIGWQAIETRKAAVATQISAEAMRDSVRLQKILGRQWVVLENWSLSREMSHDGWAKSAILSFNVINATDAPLRLKRIEMFVMHGTEGPKPNVLLAPKKPYYASFVIRLSESEIAEYEKTSLRLGFHGQVIFIDKFGDRQSYYWGVVCRGGVKGFRFFESENWLSDEDDEEEEH